MFYVSLKLYPSEIRKKERYPLFCKEDIFPFLCKSFEKPEAPGFSKGNAGKRRNPKGGEKLYRCEVSRGTSGRENG
ncbi:MAG TPA: hypothetical protein H9753_15050 [Candidatus Blautia merdavium]|uniref:Uncharacterized protein n=1 Tax=Candidatus Blautia merdavium TaxID=2838494 RepID=A0A9D2PRW1_9FIRM|nr:hypothetical protein [Candidatus Blautia merdavium]